MAPAKNEKNPKKYVTKLWKYVTKLCLQIIPTRKLMQTSTMVAGNAYFAQLDPQESETGWIDQNHSQEKKL